MSNRYAADPDAQRAALALFDRVGVIAGVLDAPIVMDDGDYRGRVEIVPATSVAEHTPHLTALFDAFDTFEAFFGDVAREVTSPLQFWYRGLAIKFFKTYDVRTPSAWVKTTDAIAYNVNGELFDTLEGVRETMFHELFHVNDNARNYWSDRELTDSYEKIIATCGTDDVCLEQHAPHETKVDGGIFYAFHPTSGVREYAAELAIRYLREQLRAATGEPISPPFKCLTPENGHVWKKLVDEFFGGFDRVPNCNS